MLEFHRAYSFDLFCSYSFVLLQFLVLKKIYLLTILQFFICIMGFLFQSSLT